MTFDVFNVVELRGEGILNINNEDLPVGLALIEESHDTENFNLLNLANIADLFADLTNIKRVVVALGLGLGVDDVGVLPGLEERG